MPNVLFRSRMLLEELFCIPSSALVEDLDGEGDLLEGLLVTPTPLLVEDLDGARVKVSESLCTSSSTSGEGFAGERTPLEESFCTPASALAQVGRVQPEAAKAKLSFCPPSVGDCSDGMALLEEPLERVLLEEPF
jgi:hypothetical protein